jgi:hypothetical protein
VYQHFISTFNNSPSVAAFNLSSQPEPARSPVRPLMSSSLPIGQQLMLALLASESGRAASISQEAIGKVYKDVKEEEDKQEIKKHHFLLRMSIMPRLVKINGCQGNHQVFKLNLKNM